MSLIHDNKIRIVPLREVIKVFTPDVQRDIKVDIDQWIRIKVGSSTAEILEELLKLLKELQRLLFV